MTDEPENLTLRFLRRIDENLNSLREDFRDLKSRVSAVEAGLHRLQTTADRQADRLDRIERRLDLREHADA